MMLDRPADSAWTGEPVSVDALQDQVAALEAALMTACSFVAVLMEDQLSPVTVELGGSAVVLMPDMDVNGVLTSVTEAVATVLLAEAAARGEDHPAQRDETAHAVDLVRGLARKVVH